MKKIRLRTAINLRRNLIKSLLIMKLTALLILLASTQISAKVFSQETKISLHLKDANLSKLFKAIEKKTDFRFVYSNNILPSDKKVSIDVKNTALSEILLSALSNTALTYSSLDNKLIIISVKNSVVQFRKVTGRVTDGKGDPLVGVTVRVVGTNIATATDADGNYSIEVSGNGSLEFSYVGYGSQTIETNEKTTINLVMQESASSLSDVVVVGYGTQKKVNLTGSVATISAKDLSVVPAASVSSLLAGKLPGLIAVQGSGEPGNDNPSLSIRGFGQALVVVDGIAGRDFTRLDPSEIESITVLKDAASAAVYGVSGGNGVILVTTKRGTISKPELNYQFNYGVQHITRYPRFVNSAEYATLKNDASVNLGGPLIYTPEQIEKYREGTDPNYPNFDYRKYFVKDYAPQVQQNISVRGGSKNIKYYFLLGGINQAAMWNTKGSGNQNFKNYNFKSNVDARINDDLSISVDFSANNQYRNNLTQSAYLLSSWMQYQWPIFAPTTPDGKIASTNYGLAAYLDRDLSGMLMIKKVLSRAMYRLTIKFLSYRDCLPRLPWQGIYIMTMKKTGLRNT